MFALKTGKKRNHWIAHMYYQLVERYCPAHDPDKMVLLKYVTNKFDQHSPKLAFETMPTHF